MSVAGGLHLAWERIRRVKGEALQIFTCNQRRWKAPPLGEEAAARFREARSRAGDMPVAAHDSYLINLASPSGEGARRSLEAFVEELERASRLSIPLVVMHPGAHLGQGARAGLRRFTANLDEALSRADARDVRVLLEATAGQGTSLGASFEEIAFILESSRHENRLGVCLDTCHVFAAGYDLRTPEALGETLDRFHRLIGLERIGLFHLNDSKTPLGSRRDRHEHIGRGRIGLEAFRHLLRDPRFRHLPMVLETPKGKDLEEDRRSLRLLRSLERVEDFT